MVQHVLQNMNEIVSNEYSENHQALDIISSDNTQSDIIALESGIVETVIKNAQTTNHNTKGNATYGNYVKIKQNDGKTALYAHMKYGSINVNPGDYIEKGTIIGTMGSTGNAYGNHLHLEISNENGFKENPIESLNKEETKEEVINKAANKEELKTEIKEVEIQTTNQDNYTQDNIEYLNNNTYIYGSIVDALKEINIDSSYTYRSTLAEKNGILNYHGTYNQNIQLLKLLKEGKLKKA